MIKNIIFDFGDIFINLDKQAPLIEMTKFGFTELTPDLDAIFKSYEMGLITSDVFVEKLQGIFTNASKTQIIDAWNSIILDFPEERLKFIEKLKADNQYRLFLLSNTNDLHIDKVKESMGMERFLRFKNCFEAFYLSQEMKMRKPNANIYEKVLSDNNLNASETFFIDELSPGMPAIQAGLETGDQPISINGKPILSFLQLVDFLQENDHNQSIAFTVRKGGESGSEETYSLTPVERKMSVGSQLVTRKIIGFRPKGKTVTTYPNPFTLIIRRVKDMYLTLSGLVSPRSDVKLRNMSGPVGIVNHLSIFAKIGFKKLLWFVVFINVNLAILNLLPIPVLDGGHMFFATIEKLRGRPLPLAFLERAQMLFVVLLFSFMLYVTFFDVQRIFP